MRSPHAKAHGISTDLILVLAGTVGLVITALTTVNAALPVASPGRDADVDVVAEVAFVGPGVKRRAARGLLWDALHTRATLHVSDAIFIPAGSEARLTLADGSALTLGERTLIVMDAGDDPTTTRPDGGTVRMLRGSASIATGNEPVVLRTRASRAVFDRRSVGRVVGLSPRGEADVEIERGAALIGDGDQPRRVAAGQTVRVARDGTPGTARTLPVELVEPQADAIVAVREDRHYVRLAWRGAPARSRIQIASDAGFEAPTVDTRAPPEGSREVAVPAVGRWWWRLVDRRGAPISTARALTAVEARPPTPLHPVAGGETPLPTGARPVFAWTRTPGAGSWRIEVASDPGFGTVIGTAVTTTPTWYAPAALADGEYFWRVRPLDGPAAIRAISRRASFHVGRGAPPAAPDQLDAEIIARPRPGAPP